MAGFPVFAIRKGCLPQITLISAEAIPSSISHLPFYIFPYPDLAKIALMEVVSLLAKQNCLKSKISKRIKRTAGQKPT